MNVDDGIIHKLSYLAGVQTSYIDQQGDRKLITRHTLTAVLEALLGIPLKTPSDFLTAINSYSENAIISNVLLAWNGSLQIALNTKHSRYRDLVLHIRTHTAKIILEDTDIFQGQINVLESGSQGILSTSSRLPFGYHTFLDEALGIDALIVSAPISCPPPPNKGYGFSLFAPAYAITDARGLSEGDLSSLKLFGELAAERGAGLISTLPMFAEASAKDGAPPGQSPYSPLSRSFFHEGYLDVTKLPGLDIDHVTQNYPNHTITAQATMANLAGKADIVHPYLSESIHKLLNSSDDYLSRQRAEFINFCQEKKDLDLYANFRAAMRLYGPEIDKWPHAIQNGSLDQTLLDQDLVLVHKYAQFLMHSQLIELKNSLNKNDCGLLFDLPIGCSKDSFDVWAYREHFSANAMLGAPPDDFFQGGQNWGLPPTLPNYDRKNKYLFFRNILSTSLRYADVLRIDHILGFSRLWWIPNGYPATEGAYVSYPSDELMAIACLESYKSATHLLGEDLGTVETEFRHKMDIHGISHMRVGIFEFKDRFSAGKHRYEKRITDQSQSAYVETNISDNLRSDGNICSTDNISINPCHEFLYIDTHDTATFAGWLTAEDINVRSRLCNMEPVIKAEMLLQRQLLVEQMKMSLLKANPLPQLDAYLKLSGSTPSDTCFYHLLAALLADAALSETAYLVISLEDLIVEIKPQNIPGTGRLEGNFCRLISRQVEDILRDKNTEALLAIVRECHNLATSQHKSDNPKGIS